MRSDVVASLAVAFLVAPVHAGVLTVSPAGPTDFHQIEDAVTAAVDGDIILVQPGEYASFTVTNKALVIEADGGPCTVRGLMAINALAAGKMVSVRGIDALAALQPVASEGLRIESCDGDVRIEDGVFNAGYESALQPAFPGASILSSQSVALHGCRIVGGKNSLTSSIKAGDGVRISGSSSVSLWNCICGGEIDYAPDGSPGIGVVVDQSTLFASGTTFAGGSNPGLSAVCKPGADALHLDGGAQAHLLDSILSPGSGSPPSSPLCTSGGPAGLPIVVDLGSGSSYDIVPGVAQEFVATSPVREGQSLTFAFHGAPFESVLLLYSFSGQYLWLGGLHGTLLVGFPFVALPLGTTDALGDFEFATVVPELGAGVAGVALSCQGFFFGSSASKSLGPTSLLLLLDAAF